LLMRSHVNVKEFKQFRKNYLVAYEGAKKKHDLATIVFLNEIVPLSELPSLYKAVDSFIITSHGEGWGLPIMEAMTMELPTIATNWSGNTEFMNMQNSYLIRVERLIPGPIRGHKWAEPSVEHAAYLMRCIYEQLRHSSLIESVCVRAGIKDPVNTNSNLAYHTQRGLKARKDVMNFFSQEKVAEIILDYVKRIQWVAPLERERRRQKEEAEKAAKERAKREKFWKVGLESRIDREDWRRNYISNLELKLLKKLEKKKALKDKKMQKKLIELKKKLAISEKELEESRKREIAKTRLEESRKRKIAKTRLEESRKRVVTETKLASETKKLKQRTSSEVKKKRTKNKKKKKVKIIDTIQNTQKRKM